MIRTRSLAAAAFGLLVVAPAFAGQAKGYQVTGPVLEVTADKIAVQKGKDRWELGRDAGTKVSGGDPKVGDKVTVEYRMTATSIEVKPASGKAAGSKKKP